MAKVADFLLYLCRSLALSYSSIASYRSMLSDVFRFILPELSSHFVLHDLLRSFRLERPLPSSRVPPWDLLVVLQFLCGPPFEPLDTASLRSLSQMVLFLVSLATAWRVEELQAVSREVSFSGSDAYLSYLPEFRAKSESAVNPLPRSFCVRSLNDFVGDLPDELLLCPVRALHSYLSRTASFVSRLELFLYLLVLLLVLYLRTLLVSFFVMSSLVIIRLPPPLLPLQDLLPPLLLLPRVLIVFVVWLLCGRLRVMLLSLLFWLGLRGPLLLSSLHSIFLTFSSHPLVVLVSALWWPLVQWCRFLMVCFYSLFAPSITAGSECPLGGRCSLFTAALLCRRCVEGFREWHFDAQWSPGRANSL